MLRFCQQYHKTSNHSKLLELINTLEHFGTYKHIKKCIKSKEGKNDVSLLRVELRCPGQSFCATMNGPDG